MTPKEKAQELVDKMWAIDERYGSMGFHEAKQCALIAVDELIEHDDIDDYWIHVEKEIKKL
jgi:hypothetical protein